MEVQQTRIRTTKQKSDRYWFRVNDDDKAYVKKQMKESDVSEYFRGCMTNLVKALKRKETAKKRRQKSQKKKVN